MDDHTRDPTVAPPDGNPPDWSAAVEQWEHATLRGACVAGIELFNASEYHDSHDCFKHVWASVIKSDDQGSRFKRSATTL